MQRSEHRLPISIKEKTKYRMQVQRVHVPSRQSLLHAKSDDRITQNIGSSRPWAWRPIVLKVSAADSAIFRLAVWPQNVNKNHTDVVQSLLEWRGCISCHKNCTEKHRYFHIILKIPKTQKRWNGQDKQNVTCTSVVSNADMLVSYNAKVLFTKLSI
jgi:hypothetical protein